MSAFQIFSDGACDIPKEIASENQIEIIPFYVSLDKERYQKEIEEISLDSFYHNMIDEKGYPKTSLPSAQDYIDAFTPYLEKGKDILCLTITTTLSGSYSSACSAKEILEEKFSNAQIEIIDSWHATGSQYLLAWEAARMQREGYSLSETKSYIEKAKHQGRILFMVGDLSHLEKGGRIGKLAALSGSILSIKPLIELKEGEISTAGMSRGRKKGLQKLVELTKKYFSSKEEKPEEYLFLVGTTNTWEETEPFTESLKKEMPNACFLPTFQIGATIASHTGPGTIGVCFIKRYEYYTIKKENKN